VIIKQGHIDARQAIILLWLTVSGKELLTYPAAIIAEGFSASWLIPILAALVTGVAVLPGVALMRRFPGRSFARAGEEAVGPLIGKGVGLVVVAFLLLDAALALRQFSDALGISLLPLTPIRVIALGLVLAVAYGAYTGLEAVGRMAAFVVPWLAILFVLLYTGRSADMVLGRLMPFWGPGAGPLALISMEHTGLFSEVLILLVMFPYLRRPAAGRAAALWVIALSGAMMAVLEASLLATFDVMGTDRLLYPIIHMTHLVTLGRFDARWDPLVVLLWILLAAVKLTVLLWATSTQLGETLRLADFKPLLPVVSLLAVIGSRLPGGLQEAVNAYHFLIVHYGWVVALVLPGLLWLVVALRRRKPT
jgi:spore germination protein KB